MMMKGFIHQLVGWKDISLKKTKIFKLLRLALTASRHSCT